MWAEKRGWEEWVGVGKGGLGWGRVGYRPGKVGYGRGRVGYGRRGWVEGLVVLVYGLRVHQVLSRREGVCMYVCVLLLWVKLRAKGGLRTRNGLRARD